MLMPIFMPAQQWTTLLNPTLNELSTVWGGYCMISMLPAISRLGSSYRVTLSPPPSGSNLVLASVWVGMAATAPSFDGNQVQALFSGSGGVTLTAGGANVVSDPFTPAAQFDTSGNLLVAIGVTSGDVNRNVSLSGYTFYYKAGDSANAGTTTKSGYGSVATRCDTFIKLEALT